MSRRRRVIHKEVKKDARYASPLVASLISSVMQSGKKSIAEKIVYTAIDKTREGTDTVDPLETLNKAIENVKPRLEVKSRRVGGSTYQVPMEVRQERGTAMALRWLVNYSRARNGRSMSQKLAGELMDAANEAGSAVRKREETHKMAEANKAFAHYRY